MSIERNPIFVHKPSHEHVMHLGRLWDVCIGSASNNSADPCQIVVHATIFSMRVCHVHYSIQQNKFSKNSLRSETLRSRCSPLPSGYSNVDVPLSKQFDSYLMLLQQLTAFVYIL